MASTSGPPTGVPCVRQTFVAPVDQPGMAAVSRVEPVGPM